MEKILCVLALLVCTGITSAQEMAESPLNDFNFWIGEWTTESSIPPNWEPITGVDSVYFLLSGKLIEEVFTKDGGTNFQRGYLYYMWREKRWRHTIYDVKWGEYSFYGNREGDKITLYSDPEGTRPGLRRETFENITEHSFDYLWEASRDGGNTWGIIWKIHYIRMK